MSRPFTGASAQTHARVAGALYLIIIVLGLWSEIGARGSLIVAGDAAATAANIAAHQGLFRASFAADTVMALSDVALAVLLYMLLRPVSGTLALVAAAFRLVQTAIIALSLVLFYAALLLIDGAAGAVFDPPQLQALVALAVEMHGHGYDLGLVFFGVSCLVLGYLIVRSGYFPRLLGLLTMAAGAAYLIGSYTLFLVPDFAASVLPIYAVPLVSEIALCLWLLVRGVDVAAWERRAGQATAA